MCRNEKAKDIEQSFKVDVYLWKPTDQKGRN